MALAATTAGGVHGAPVFRPDYMFWWEQQGEYMERRQAFLRSYHFSRKQGSRERVRRSLFRSRRLVWARLRGARRLPRLLWTRLRAALSCAALRCRGSHSSRRRRRRKITASFRRLAVFPKVLSHRRSESSSGGSADWPS